VTVAGGGVSIMFVFVYGGGKSPLFERQGPALGFQCGGRCADVFVFGWEGDVDLRLVVIQSE